MTLIKARRCLRMSTPHSRAQIEMITAQKAYAILGNAGLWETARRCHRALLADDIPHVVSGDVAVCLHGYQRNTVDVDLIIRSTDSKLVKQTLEDAGLTWNVTNHEFRSNDGVPIQLWIAGDRAGDDQDVKPPDPTDEGCAQVIEGLPVLWLSRLIEVKLACGIGDLRRTHKDFADVVELVAINDLDSRFASRLHKSVRKTFRELVRNARH